jgi:hypothetical protein
MPFFSLEVSSAQPPKGMWLLIGLGAILAADIATVLSLAFLSLVGLSITNWGLGLVAAPFAGLLAGWFCWGFFILRPRRATIRRGVFFGALSSMLAHPLLWMFLTPAYMLNGPTVETASFFLGNLMIHLSVSLFSLLIVGWITTIVGGIAGGLLIYLQCLLTQRGMQRSHETD